MLIENVLFCKVRSGIQDEQIKSSAKNSGLELVVADEVSRNCLLKFKSMPANVATVIKKLANSMMFTDISFSKNAYVGKVS